MTIVKLVTKFGEKAGESITFMRQFGERITKTVIVNCASETELEIGFKKLTDNDWVPVPELFISLMEVPASKLHDLMKKYELN